MCERIDRRQVPADMRAPQGIQKLYTHITRPQEEQEDTSWLCGQRRIARMVFPECLTKALRGSRDAEIIHPRSQAVHVCELLLTAQKNAIYVSVY